MKRLLIVILALSMIVWIARMFPQVRCALRVHDRPGCYQQVIEQAVTQLPFRAAYALFTMIAADTRQDCHDLAHVFGKLTFSRYGRLPEDIGEEPFFVCANGFWHGFMTAFTWKYGNDAEAIRNLCAGRQDIEDFEKNCYHGVGIGAVGDPPDVSLWGDEPGIMTQAFGVCARIAPRDFFRDECIGGVYHQIVDSKLAGQFALPPFDFTDPLVFCDGQPAGHLPMCGGQLAPRLHMFADGDFSAVAGQLRHHIPDEALRRHLLALAARGYVISLPEDRFSVIPAVCDALAGDEHDACTQGIEEGLNNRGVSLDGLR